MIGRALAGAAAALALVGTAAAPASADPARSGQWHLADLSIADVHRITRGAGTVVALIDTGVDAGHRDLAGAILPGYNTRDSRWEDRTGREDLDGHGTNMAGIIAGRGHGSDDGILGIAPAAKILPISAPVDSWASTTFLTEAVDFAIAHDADVINMSFGGAGDETMHEAIRKARAAGIVLVAASGNRNKQGEYPGRYPEVLTVGAYGRNREIAPISVTGPQVDLVAPGDRIATTSISSSGYALTTGTSDAAAVVSGAAALIRARYPKLDAAEVVHRLIATAEDAGPPGRDDTYGNGRLDIVRALTTDVKPAPAASPSSTIAASDPPEGTNRSILVIGVVLLAGAIVVAAVVLLRRRRPNG